MYGMLRNTLLCTAMTIAFVVPAQAKGKTLVTLDGANGEDVFASPIEANDGNLYGTTVYGGANGEGTIFKLTPKGKYTILHSFCAQSGCSDGANGEWLTEGADGNFYGQTYSGGSANVGTIFEITSGGTFTSLYSWCSQTNCTDGANPQSAFVQTSDGTFWGTTIGGGANNKGTVFKFVPGNAPAIVYSFCSQSACTDGSNPFTGLVLASDGNFYGVTAEGGSNGDDCGLNGYGCGTVFRITPKGALTTLYTFCKHAGCKNGGIPQGQLIQAKDGDLYGTTDVGGVQQYGGAGQGTVFKISLNGKFATLYRFCPGSSCTDGIDPTAGVIQGTDGNFYGTTQLGGPEGWGNVYRLTGKGTLTSVYSVNQTDGASIAAGVVQASNGLLYGGSTEGGSTSCTYGCGVIFDASPKGKQAATAGHGFTIPADMPRPAIPATPLSLLHR